MSIKKNPYGVGYSGDNYQVQDARCRCCHQPFQAKVYAMHGVPLWCENCVEHAPSDSESLEAENVRLKEHEAMYRQRLAMFRKKITDQEAEVADRRQQTKSALATREKWKTILAEVRALHEQSPDGKKCSCGLNWPCETRRVIDLDPHRADEIATRAYQDLIKRERSTFALPDLLQQFNAEGQ